MFSIFRRAVPAATLMLISTGCGRSDLSAPQAQFRLEKVRAQVTVAQVRKKALAASAEFTGNLLPRRRGNIVAEVTGIVRSIPQVGARIEATVDGTEYSEQLGILPGHVVKRGDVLLEIDTTDFELQIKVATAKLLKSKADLAKLKAWERPESVKERTALRDEARARHKRAETDLERALRLQRQGAGVGSDVDARRAEVETTQAVLESQEAMLAKAMAGPTDEEVAVQQALVDQSAAELAQRQRELEKATITAPFDGVITEALVEVGDHISPTSGRLFELLDLRYVVAEAGIPESMIGRVRMRDLAQVFLAGSREGVPGMVIAINGKVDPESRTYRVRVAVDNSKQRHKAGQFVRVVFDLGSDQQRPVVPTRAMTFVEGQPHVFILEGSVARQRLVKPGVSTDVETEILAGLDGGEQVIVDDPAVVVDGMEVTVRTESQSAASVSEQAGR